MLGMLALLTHHIIIKYSLINSGYQYWRFLNLIRIYQQMFLLERDNNQIVWFSKNCDLFQILQRKMFELSKGQTVKWRHCFKMS